MATSQNNSNTTSSSNNKITFSAVDFQRWNQTTSVVNIPSRLVKTSKIPQLRKELINAIGERKVAAVQALSPTRYRIEYRYEPQNKQTANLMEIEPLSSPPNRRSLNAKHQPYTRWDGSQAVILSPTETAASSPEPNGPAPATISTSPPAAHLAALRQIFHLPQTSEESSTNIGRIFHKHPKGRPSIVLQSSIPPMVPCTALRHGASCTFAIWTVRWLI